MIVDLMSASDARLMASPTPRAQPGCCIADIQTHGGQPELHWVIVTYLGAQIGWFADDKLT